MRQYIIWQVELLATSGMILFAFLDFSCYFITLSILFPQAKSTSILQDYVISTTVLGLGINGKVVECYHKISHRKYALKVCLNNYIDSMQAIISLRYV